MKIKTKWTTDLESTVYKDALIIRHDVFVFEQGVPVDLEIDELENQTEHVVLYQEDEPIAVARILELENDTYKIQRVATLKEFRGKGFGAELMKQIELRIKELNATKITLGAQNTALDFYKKLGYSVEGDEFMDAGIPHHTMIKNISSK